MARAPEPDRAEFKGAIADHIIQNWYSYPKWVTQAITEAINGNRGAGRPYSVKLRNDVSVNVGKDHMVRGFDGNTGRRIKDVETMRRIDKLKK